MKNFEGVFTALITPFSNGEVDFDSLKKLVRFQLDNGIQGFVVNGTTGESPTLTREERERVFKFVQTEVARAVPLVLGTGTNATRTTIEQTKRAAELGADAALVVVPYYNKPPQRGLAAHFREVAQSVELPILLYNVPGRTITRLEIETLQELSRVSNIKGIKEATGDLAFAAEVRDGLPREFLLTSGDDGTSYDFCAQGGHGVISVCSHIMPREMVNFIADARNKKTKRDEFNSFASLIQNLYLEANPIPVKFALKKMGIIKSDELRLPLQSLAEQFQPALTSELKAKGLVT